MHVSPTGPRKPILLLAALFALELSAATRTDRYALILADPPLATLAGSREQLESEAIDRCELRHSVRERKEWLTGESAYEAL